MTSSLTFTPRDFVDKWRFAADLKERSAAQEHFIDLCRVLGHSAPAEDEDPRVAAIAQAARDLVEQRDRWLNPGTLDARALKSRTLTNLYNQNPTWLHLAH